MLMMMVGDYNKPKTRRYNNRPPVESSSSNHHRPLLSTAPPLRHLAIHSTTHKQQPQKPLGTSPARCCLSTLMPPMLLLLRRAKSRWTEQPNQPNQPASHQAMEEKKRVSFSRWDKLQSGRWSVWTTTWYKFISSDTRNTWPAEDRA